MSIRGSTSQVQGTEVWRSGGGKGLGESKGLEGTRVAGGEPGAVLEAGKS